MLYGNSAISSRFLQDGLNLNGQSMPSPAPKSQRSLLIDKAMSDMEVIANNSSIDEVVTTILSNSVPALNMYVNGQREVPERNLNSLAFQAAMLRIADIAAIAEKLNISDYEATCMLEQDEDSLIRSGHFNQKYIMPYEVQAAINILIDEIINVHKAGGGSGKMSDIVTQLKQSAPGNYYIGAPDTLQGLPGGVTYYNDHPDLVNYDTLTSVPDAPNGATGGVYYAPEPKSGVIDFIDKAIATVDKIGTGIQTVADTAGNAIDKVKDKVSDIGGDIAGDSIKKALIKNLPLIIGIVVLIVLIVLFITYAAKRNN